MWQKLRSPEYVEARLAVVSFTNPLAPYQVRRGTCLVWQVQLESDTVVQWYSGAA